MTLKASSNGMTNTVCTLYELHSGDNTGAEGYCIVSVVVHVLISRFLCRFSWHRVVVAETGSWSAREAGKSRSIARLCSRWIRLGS